MRKLSMLVLALSVAACDKSKPELERKVAQLEQISAEKDSLLNDASTTAQFITEVNEEMAKVRNLNSGKLVQAGNGEKFLSPAEQRAQVLTRVKAITARLKESEGRLDASRKRVGRKNRRVERFFEQVIQAGIDDGSIHARTAARLAMLAVLGMCNAVINWRESDRSRHIPSIAAGFAELVARGVALPESRRGR